MSSRGHVFALSALAVWLIAAPAGAADLTAPFDPSTPIEQKIEFGSGWYIRGDIGFERTNVGVSPSAAVAMAAPSAVLNSNSLNGYSLSLGGGYKFNNWIRVDLLGESRRPLTASAGGASLACPIGAVGTPAGGPFTGETFVDSTCTPNSTVTITRYDALANVYLDLGTWYGVTPYIGGGIGAAFGHESGATSWTQADAASYNVTFTDALTGASDHVFWDRSNGTNYVNFAWAAMAGFAVSLTDRLQLDVGYRYFNAGRLSGATTSVPLTSQEVRTGLRYQID